MQKITIAIDLSKLDKTRIKERTYTNKEGQDVTIREYEMDIVPLRDHEQIAEGPSWKLMRTHFVTDAATKEERASKTKMRSLGSGKQFIDKDAPQSDEAVFNSTPF